MSGKKNKLFVGNLAWKASDENLRTLFETHGAVLSVKIVIDQYTNKSKGFGFVEMETTEGAEAAIKALDNFEFLGRNLRVSFAQERDRESRGDSRGDRGDKPYSPRSGGGGNSYQKPYQTTRSYK